MKASKGANKKAAAKGGGGGPSGDTAAAPVSTAGQRQEPVHNTRRSKKGPKVPDKEKPALSKKAAAAAAAAAAPAAAASSDAAAHSGDDGVPGGGKGSGGDGGGAPKTKGGRGGGRAKAKAKAKPAGALQGAASRSYSRHDGAPKLPHYESGRATWDAEETRTLHEGLRRYPPQHHSNMTIYVKIAAMLPRKTVSLPRARARKVLLGAAAAAVSADEKARRLRGGRGVPPPTSSSSGGTATASTATTSSSSSSGGGERMRCVLFSCPSPRRAAPPPLQVRDVAAEVWKLRRRMHDTAHQAALPLEDGRGGKRQRVGQGPEDGGSAYPPTLVHAPVSGPHLLDRHMENRLQQLLGDNVMIQGKMRDHLAASRLDDNIPLMAKFYDNIAAMQALMDSLPERMPPLDVQLAAEAVQQEGQQRLDKPPEGSARRWPHAAVALLREAARRGALAAAPVEGFYPCAHVRLAVRGGRGRRCVAKALFACALGFRRSTRQPSPAPCPVSFAPPRQVNTTLLNRPPPPPLPHGQQQNGANFAQPMMMAVDPVNVRDAAGAHGYAMASGAAAVRTRTRQRNRDSARVRPALRRAAPGPVPRAPRRRQRSHRVGAWLPNDRMQGNAKAGPLCQQLLDMMNPEAQQQPPAHATHAGDGGGSSAVQFAAGPGAPKSEMQQGQTGS
ncbi:hypothetical protein JKP88DRAFT_261000 [Tribonema minus]|uniref:Myb-like domain-containing protein n=1 Tax=Tribonema minus TaxID=303371 RepID=A0A836CHT8_9STRA|nr:hypothetical protein JKP88DRAFT_261000 [Tribonema minus]